MWNQVQIIDGAGQTDGIWAKNALLYQLWMYLEDISPGSGIHFSLSLSLFSSYF